MADESANPLLLGWVKEWWDTARERNSKGVTTYKHAYDALKACPLTFDHPSQLQQLKGFGPKLCQRLTDQLKKHCEENGLPMPEHPGLRRRGQGQGPDSGGEGASTQPPATKKKRTAKAYVPAYRSGPYALVVALSTRDEDATLGMTKAELIEEAQPHCDSSFTAPSDPTKFYTAWSSMKTLVQKELVYERGRPLKRYALTDEGWQVAKRIRETAVVTGVPGSASRSESGLAALQGVAEDESGHLPPAPQRQYADVVQTGAAVSDEASLPSFTPISLPPGTFTVQLLLDQREIRAKTDRDYMAQELAKRGCTPLVRSLELGDALWVAKVHDAGFLARHGAEGDEVVLDYIVERKRLDDLIGSIKDGRFHEQKFRLRRAGVPHVIYLVEDMSLDPSQFHKYEEAVQSAIASSQVVNGYFLKRTQKMDDTIAYLARLTALLKKKYEAKTLAVVPTRHLTAQNHLPLMSHLRETQPLASHHITYPAFASLGSKSDTITLRDLYLKMLMCTKGITGEKAVEIQKKWKTPNEFVKAFEQCGTGNEGKKRKANLVSDQMNGLVGRKKIAKVVSQRVAQVWGDA
ncbi:endonuclease [Thozetella sp. PMI_491]|nr:endonuclease [Thozetella sp. PMI_491]